MGEAELLNLVRLKASSLGSTLFRNNTGMLQDRKGRYVRYGLCVGSSDLIGWTPVEIDGCTRGLITAIECKYLNTKATKEQLNFIEQVRKAGGIAGIVRSVDDAIELITRGIHDGDRERET